MSTGAGMALNAPVAAQVARVQARHVLGDIRGSIQQVGPGYVAFTDLKGNLGKLKLTGHGFGRITVASNQFEGASLLMSGPGGTLTIDLFRAPIRNGVRGTGTINTQMLIRSGTGDYKDAAGSAGSFVATVQDLRKLYKRTKSLLTDKTDVNSLSDAAYFLLDSTKPPKK